MLDFLNASLFGIVEGFTEFLPISSTAHLILVSNLLKIEQTEYIKSFEIIIQLGAILAVVFLYWKSFTNLKMIKKLIVAFIPTGIIGLIFYKLVKQYLIGNIWIVMTTLFLGGIFLIFFEKFFQVKKEKIDLKRMTYSQCLSIGFFQTIAMIPGVSRSAATIIGGLLLGISRVSIVEFSFLLAVPTMIAATTLDLWKNASTFNTDQFQFLLVGFIISFITAIISIRWLLSYVKKHDFSSFGIYRILIVVLFLIFFIF